MIRAVLFDYGGVLGSNASDIEGRFRGLSEISGLPVERLKDIFSQHWPCLRVGMGSVESFWNDVSEKSPLHPPPEELSEYYLKQVSIDEDVLDIARSLDIRKAILSNESREWIDYKWDRFGLGDIFEKAYCSAYLGVAKPDAGIFLHVLEDMGLDAEDVLFIDDLERNVCAAAALGIDTILFRDARQLEKEFKDRAI